ncbi:RNA-directed DNA polymerase, eukaryota [Tanacetum coccineum]
MLTARYNCIAYRNSKSSFASILKEGPQVQSPDQLKPSLVLDDSCLKDRDFSMSLMGKVREVSTIPNLYIFLDKEGFNSVNLTYLGGLWVLIELDSLTSKEKFLNHTTNTFSKIASMWGDLVVWEDSEVYSLSCKHLCLKTKIDTIINKSFKIILRGKVYWVRAKELDAWNPKLLGENLDNSSSDDESSVNDKGRKYGDNDHQNTIEDNEVDRVSESSCMHENVLKNHDVETPQSKDPFNIYELLTKKKDNVSCPKESDQDNVPRSKESDLTFPPGFTPDLANNVIDKGENVTPSTSIKEQVIRSNKGSPLQRSTNMAIVGGSILEVMDDLVKKKRSLGYIRSMIDRWEGETVILGDFNEVWTEQERFGSIFNVQGANMFNNFISMARLIDLPLGGYSYTWAHKSATKMSKLERFLVSEGLLALFPYLSGICLDRHLSDHRPILMCESVLDYGPTPFCMYHSWFKIEGFNKFVEDSWNSMNISDPNAMICLKKKFQTLKYAIKSWSKENKKKLNATKAAVQNKLSEVDKILDQNGGNPDVLNHRPDRFSFEFFRKFWNLIDKDIVAAISEFFDSANRQILDGPFILNELLSWCKYKKVNAMIFKVDFEKAFNSVRWDYLDDVLNSFGFGEKWRSWINGCLSSSMGSVLVNGNPTSEFHFHKGLKQGDPLSPFLFILIMESLHLSFNRVLDVGLYKGISINNSLMISHLFYADDAVFVGKWGPSNIKTIVHVLKCFYLASGLKINLHKSKLMEIGINKEEIDLAASIVGCLTFSSPFKYLGVQVGASMSRLNSWNEVETKISSRLSRWKLKTVSIGGRLTLLKSVLLAIPLYHMSLFKVPTGTLHSLESIWPDFFNGIDRSERKMVWIRWDNILASKKHGGLKAIHGAKGGLDTRLSSNRNSIWLDIVRDISSLDQKGIDLFSFVRKKVGNGENSLFWIDTWSGEVALKTDFPRLYALELCKDILVADKLRHATLDFSFRRHPRGGAEEEQFHGQSSRLIDVILPQIHDRWFWSLDGSCDFSFNLSEIL